MTRQNSITALLAIVALLLTLNLIVTGSPPAEAQVAAGPVQPTVVAAQAYIQETALGVAPTSYAHRIWRFWSDGTVDTSLLVITKWFEPNPEASCQLFFPERSCGPSVIIPGTCPADVDKTGDVGITDFLGVLAAWGPCR